MQAAAVVGRRFAPDLLAAVADTSGDIGASLSCHGANPRLVHPANADYMFKHALVREAVLWSPPSAARAALHLKIAEEIERRSANRLPEVAEALAHHYAATSRADKAFRYLAMAAKKCLDIYSIEEAEEYARQALLLLELQMNTGASDLAVADVVAQLLADRFPGTEPLGNQTRR